MRWRVILDYLGTLHVFTRVFIRRRQEGQRERRRREDGDMVRVRGLKVLFLWL